MDRKLNRFRAILIILAILLAVAGEGCSIAKKIEPVGKTSSAVTASKSASAVKDQYIAKTKDMNATLQREVERQNVSVTDGRLNVAVVTLNDRYLPALAEQLTQYGRDVAKANGLQTGTFQIAIPNGGISWKSKTAGWTSGVFTNVRAKSQETYTMDQLYIHYGGFGRGLVKSAAETRA